MNSKEDRRKGHCNDICRRLRKVNAHRLIAHKVRNQINKRQQQDKFSHDRNDNGARRVARRYKGHLASDLDTEYTHHTAVDPKRISCKIDQLGIGRKDTCEYFGKQHDRAPNCERIDKAGSQKQPEGLFHTFCVFRSVVKTRNWLCALGYALQLVNILRDIAEDCRKHGRVYLPADDMALFGVTVDDIYNQRYNYRMRQLLAYEAALAEKYFCESEELYQAMSVEDRNALIPAQAMSLIYHNVLEKMQDDEYRVFERRYSVNNFRKLWYLLRARIGSFEFPSVAEWGFLYGEKKDS